MELTPGRPWHRLLRAMGVVLVLWCGGLLTLDAVTAWAADSPRHAGNMTIQLLRTDDVGCFASGEFVSDDAGPAQFIRLRERIDSSHCAIGEKVRAVHVLGSIARLDDAYAAPAPPVGPLKIVGLLVGVTMLAFAARLIGRDLDAPPESLAHRLSPIRALRRSTAKHWSERR